MRAIRLKPDTYDGSVSLNEFLIQFELLHERIIGWGKQKPRFWYHVWGKAWVVLESVQGASATSVRQVAYLPMGKGITGNAE